MHTDNLTKKIAKCIIYSLLNKAIELTIYFQERQINTPKLNDMMMAMQGKSYHYQIKYFKAIDLALTESNIALNAANQID